MLALIVGIVFVVLGASIGMLSDVNPAPTIFVSLGIIFIIFGTTVLNDKNKITPMDVYQGKTTLEITYKDGVPVDSVVVFKEKEK